MRESKLVTKVSELAISMEENYNDGEDPRVMRDQVMLEVYVSST